MMFCIKCGEKLNDDALFCTKCGTPTRQLQQQKAVVNPNTITASPKMSGTYVAVIAAVIVVGMIITSILFAVLLFSDSSSALTGTYGSYSEYYNNYYWKIEFNSDGTCVVKPLYEGYVSGTYKKNDNGKYMLTWNLYYGTWVAEKIGDELFITGTGLGTGATFEKIS